MVCRTPSTARGPEDPSAFTVTHPFHPLSGKRFDLVGYAHTWGEHRVFFRKPGDTRVYSMSANWTDVEAVDPVLGREARAHFRVDDLLVLIRVLREIDPGGDVRCITPTV